MALVRGRSAVLLSKILRQTSSTGYSAFWSTLLDPLQGCAPQGAATGSSTFHTGPDPHTSRRDLWPSISQNAQFRQVGSLAKQEEAMQLCHSGLNPVPANLVFNGVIHVGTGVTTYAYPHHTCTDHKTWFTPQKRRGFDDERCPVQILSFSARASDDYTAQQAKVRLTKTSVAPSKRVSTANQRLGYSWVRKSVVCSGVALCLLCINLMHPPW